MKLLKLTFAPLLVLIIHVIASILGWYEICWWLDTPMHFLGGVSIGVTSLYFIKYSEIESKGFNNILLKFILILSFTALAAVAWETLEYNLDKAFGTVMQPSIRDTMKDLAFGLLGGLLTTTSLLRKKKTAR